MIFAIEVVINFLKKLTFDLLEIKVLSFQQMTLIWPFKVTKGQAEYTIYNNQ